MCLNCRPLIKAIDAYLAKADSDLEEQLAIEGYADATGTVKDINEMEEAVNALLESYGENLVKELDASVDLKEFFKDNWPKIKRGTTLGTELRRVFLRDFKRVIRRLSSVYIQQTDAALEVTQVSKATTQWVTDWSGELSQLMKLETDEKIESVLKKGLEDGKGIDEISRAISDSGIRNPGYRSRRTALTEVLRAHSVAQQEAFDQNPAVEDKVWKHTGAYRNTPRKNHVEMNGQRVPKGDKFTLKGLDDTVYEPMYPRDTILPASESVNCHCLAQPVVNEDILGLPLEERRRLQEQAIKNMDDEWEKKLDAKNRAKAGIEV